MILSLDRLHLWQGLQGSVDAPNICAGFDHLIVDIHANALMEPTFIFMCILLELQHIITCKHLEENVEGPLH